MAALTSKTFVNLSRRQAAPVIGAACVSKRDGSNLATYKRGSGGRSSFSGIVATVLGSSGFMGKYVVNRLGKIGSQVICPYRADPYYMKDLRLAGDLGQILFLPYSIDDEASLRKVMKYSNVVINLVGRDWPTKNFSFEDVNVKGAQRIARIARETGVEKLVHFSHLNASQNPPEIYLKGGSQYLKTKALGEKLVRDEFPDAIIFRPADIYGSEDRFLRYYANPWRRAHGTVPLWKKGTQTIKMPVFCSNVAEGVINAIHSPDAVGQTYDCVGPNSYQLSELVDFFYRCMRHENFRRSYLTPFFKLKVQFMANAPSYPILSMDKLDREHVTDVLSGGPTLEDLGVQLRRIEDQAPWELKPFKKHSYYEETVGEFKDPDPPVALA